MSCKDFQIRDRLPEYASGTLESDEKERIRIHLAHCARCRDHLEIVTLFSEDHVPEPPPGFWTSLPGRVTAVGARKPRRVFHLPIPAWAWGLAAAVLVAVILWPRQSVPPKVEGEMLAEYYLQETGSFSLGIEVEILQVSGLQAADMDRSLDQEIDLSGELDDIDPMGDAFHADLADLYEGMDGTTIRIFESLIEGMTPKGVERG